MAAPNNIVSMPVLVRGGSLESAMPETDDGDGQEERAWPVSRGGLEWRIRTLEQRAKDDKAELLAIIREQQTRIKELEADADKRFEKVHTYMLMGVAALASPVIAGFIATFFKTGATG